MVQRYWLAEWSVGPTDEVPLRLRLQLRVRLRLREMAVPELPKPVLQLVGCADE